MKTMFKALVPSVIFLLLPVSRESSITFFPCFQSPSQLCHIITFHSLLTPTSVYACSCVIFQVNTYRTISHTWESASWAVNGLTTSQLSGFLLRAKANKNLEKISLAEMAVKLPNKFYVLFVSLVLHVLLS